MAGVGADIVVVLMGCDVGGRLIERLIGGSTVSSCWERQLKTAQAIPIFEINKSGILTRMLVSTAIIQQQQRSVLILHASLLLISGNWARMKCGTPATYGNSIRARQSGNNKQHGVCLVRAMSR